MLMNGFWEAPEDGGWMLGKLTMWLEGGTFSFTAPEPSHPGLQDEERS